MLHVYGTPFFIEAELPIATETSNTKFRRLMIAQDTGSAIVGPARADIYFGAGDEAGKIAGRIKTSGAVRDADAARARSGRGGPQDAAARAAARVRAEAAACESAPAQAEAAPPDEQAVPLPRPRPKT